MTIDNCYFQSNQAQSSIPYYITTTYTTVYTDTYLIGGGAIIVDNNAYNLTIDNCYFQSNQAQTCKP